MHLLRLFRQGFGGDQVGVWACYVARSKDRSSADQRKGSPGFTPKTPTTEVSTPRHQLVVLLFVQGAISTASSTSTEVISEVSPVLEPEGTSSIVPMVGGLLKRRCRMLHAGLRGRSLGPQWTSKPLSPPPNKEPT